MLRFFKQNYKALSWAVIIFMTAYIAFIPLIRTSFLTEIDYNEGWNIYAADMLRHGKALYAVKYGWTTVNYPFLSFFVLANLQRVTHDYLFTARVLSLISLFFTSIFVGLIARNLGASRGMSVIASLFCFSVFCAGADYYVGVDDPQMFSLAFYTAGLLVYIRYRFSNRKLLAIAASAFILIIAFYIKQNPIDFILAVFVDLLLTAIPLALCFTAFCTFFSLCFLLISNHFYGPYYLTEFFAKRNYVLSNALLDPFIYFLPLLVPFALATYAMIRARKDPAKRIICIFFVLSFFIGMYFKGGQGVSINAFFSATIAISILLGISEYDIPWALNKKWYFPFPSAVIFVWLAIPLALTDHVNVSRKIRELKASSNQFQQDVHFMSERPGPAICESLLLCFEAGKPYAYDPFNATRLIRSGKLDESVLLNDLKQKRYAVVQFDNQKDDDAFQERFAPSISSTISTYYRPSVQNENSIILVPR